MEFIQIQWVFYLFLVLFALLIGFFLYLVIKKARVNCKREEVENYKESIQESFIQYMYLQDENLKITPKNDVQTTAVEELLLALVKVVNGEEILHFIQRYAERELSALYRKQLRHRRWSVRMNTLYAIEGLHMVNLLDDVRKVMEKKQITVAEESQILKILVRFHDPHYEQYLFNEHYKRSEFTYRSLLSMMNDEQFEKFIVRFNEHMEEVQLATIDIIGINRNLEQLPFLEKQLHSTSDETRIRSLKALNELSYVSDTSRLLRHIKSDLWEERMMAAKLLSKAQGEEAIMWLEVLLNDRHFLVRSNAARSITQLPNGYERLRRISNTTTDLFARDMANEWLEKGGELDAQ